MIMYEIMNEMCKVVHRTFLDSGKVLDGVCGLYVVLRFPCYNVSQLSHRFRYRI